MTTKYSVRICNTLLSHFTVTLKSTPHPTVSQPVHIHMLMIYYTVVIFAEMSALINATFVLYVRFMNWDLISEY